MFDRWSLDRWTCAKHLHKDLSTFLVIDRLADGLHEISDGNVKLHLMFKGKGARTLLVFFHGAIRGKYTDSYTLPVFSGSNIANDIDADQLMLSDASLSLSSDNIRLAWFSGTKDYDLPSRLRDIIASVAANGNYSRLILIGGSGGGFASLRLSKDLPTSIAVVWNPQTDIGQYGQAMVRAYTSGCFERESYNRIPKMLRHQRMMDLKRVDPESFAGGIIYFQNFPDVRHVNKHAKPFLEAFSGGGRIDFNRPGIWHVNDRITFILGDWEGRHTPPPRPVIVDAIEAAIACDGSDTTRAYQSLSADRVRGQLFKTIGFSVA